MIKLIIAYDVNVYIDGDKSEPHMFLEGSMKANPKHGQWTRINKVLKIWIYASISSCMFGNISCKNITFEMSHNVEKKFVSTFRTYVMEIKLQL